MDSPLKNGSHPVIALEDEDGKKLRLQLRMMSFRQELSSLPQDAAELHKMLITARGKKNETIYQMVLIWNKLASKHKNYWTAMHFASEPEYLAYYGLPDGNTLAQWTVMVNLFNRTTFVLLGDEALSFMMHAVGEFQTNAEMRKKDYGEIFDHYCREHESFDKTAFYDVVWKFVQNRYKEQIRGRPSRPRASGIIPRRRSSVAEPVQRRSEVIERPKIDRAAEKIDAFSGWLKKAVEEVLLMSKRERQSVHGSLSQLISEAELAIRALERSYKA
ncbi:MAG: hypothetical protein A3C11_01185 [Candidatus Sungbacteria bacterium RIFCSPHIGHO2_02_FULL_49_12]|uniref:Uncharacterized protein n=1 Tax=Candidatus Sungbacteria bacterium RIFCSPHIGHO2_02_FULL_49_12 TaxID=1802271 RepID=A0A1G2KNU7_9BACT|nr:MAG: hypothetical protein A3C11_01185 [Candidatus Sungbacteria bacterium RIFCSPHIGHO2_02_FULL_49_12]HLD63810.1 hypothetical protein [Candidatus Peribacteraceae bacterium]